MSNTALLFAGQGAQALGMGKDLAEKYPAARALFDRANAAVGYDLAGICFHGSEPELTKTENAQPGIYLVSWVAFQLLKELVGDLKFEATAGLSLGETTALAAANALSFEEGLKLVRQRGRFMHEACEATRGAMAAIIGLDEATTREICAEAGVELAKTKGAKKAVPLPVAGAYHSRLMAGAQPRLRASLASVRLQSPTVTVVSNVTARPHSSVAEIQSLLVDQLTAPVRWEESMRFLLAQRFTRFIELGPGKALSGFMKRIDKNAGTFNVADAPSLEATVKALGVKRET